MSREARQWGESRAADRLWSVVAGYGPSKAGSRLLVFLQACIDDSEDHIGGTFVLAGYIAPAKDWEAFSVEWEALLATDGVYDEPGGPRYFKMKRFARPSRLPRVEGFYRIIEKHARLAISCKFNVHELRRAAERVWSPGVAIDFEPILSKYVFGYRALLDMFHTFKHDWPEAIPLGENVDFIFDEQKEADKFLREWAAYIAKRPKELAGRYGQRPIPLDEKEYLPLQAADLWAWWVRKWCSEGDELNIIEWPRFGPFEEERRGFHKVHMTFDEDQITREFMKFVADGVRPFQIVHDRAGKVPPMHGRNLVP